MFFSESQESRYTMSKLMVFGPSSFPLLTTRSGAVVMAGAYYGAGRVVVVPHETLLANTPLMVGSALWVSGASNVIQGDQWKAEIPQFSVDPRSKAWSRLEDDWCYISVGRRASPNHNIQWVTRDNLLKVNPKSYITEGHYDDNRESLLEYVRNGGGLIVGGHSWWWEEKRTDSRLTCLLDHPGNRFLTEFGLAFSSSFIDHRDAKYPMKTGEVPSIKPSYFYFALMRAKGRKYKKHDEDLYNEFYLHIKEMEKMGRFKDIVSLNKKYLDSCQK